MQVFSYRSAGQWQQTRSTSEHRGSPADPALDEIQRSLSDCFRCNNLVVLTGLGTSLHVNVDGTNRAGGRNPIEGKKLAPTMWDLWTRVQAATGEHFEKVLGLSRLPDDERQKSNIEALLSHCKVAAEFLADSDEREVVRRFIHTAESTVRDAVRFLEPDDDVTVHADFLRRLSRRSPRKMRSKLFTTNYDLCFEYAARQGRYVVVDGFSHSSPQVFDSLYFTYDIVRRDTNLDSHDFISNVFLLYKLHGSIDWMRNPTTNEIEKKPDCESPLLVYPRNTKYELAFEQPYFEMMSSLQAALRQPDTGLLILGFGFNDNHIAEPILSAINSNLSLKVAVCDPGLGPRVDDSTRAGIDATNAHLKKIRYLIEHGDARLALIGATFEEIVPQLPDIAAETDLEQHLERIRRLRGENT
ncbi:hypothetical protein AWB77_06830 [Caballeronia fortuita]|uniref:Uncharacterized protein n=1 Tax=Caballeronia fortuita TaxID=1777138 RepID=A0A158E9Q5_9BURK|nr:SIR2 family protein [Caballeronia fortuita]SAL03605.1 hypothetical protein AWB77_06830 [Caballeronia fortuita]